MLHSEGVVFQGVDAMSLSSISALGAWCPEYVSNIRGSFETWKCASWTLQRSCHGSDGIEQFNCFQAVDALLRFRLERRRQSTAPAGLHLHHGRRSSGRPESVCPLRSHTRSGTAGPDRLHRADAVSGQGMSGPERRTARPDLSPSM